MKRHPAEIVLSTLLRGSRVSINSYTYEWDDGLCIVAKRDWTEEVLLSADYSLDGFVKLCEGLSDEQLFDIGASNVLQEWRRR